jgi:hypothetical protein
MVLSQQADGAATERAESRGGISDASPDLSGNARAEQPLRQAGQSSPLGAREAVARPQHDVSRALANRRQQPIDVVRPVLPVSVDAHRGLIAEPHRVTQSCPHRAADAHAFGEPQPTHVEPIQTRDGVVGRSVVYHEQVQVWTRDAQFGDD